jgi:hypothetical protein
MPKADMTGAGRGDGGERRAGKPARASVVAGLAVLAAALVSSARAQGDAKPCLVSGSDQGVVEGRLGVMEGIGPAAFIVTVPGGICLEAGEGHPRIDGARSVQLFSRSADGYLELYRMAGERVYVRGRATGTRTFQQRAPIVMEVIEIATR